MTIEYKEALALIGGLSNPSKMPWYGWSTSAVLCNVGSKLRKKAGSVCASCYAHKGFYNMGVVRAAMERRVKSLQDPRFVEAFVSVLKYRFAKDNEDRFRWHDSGDLQNIRQLRQFVAIAEACPEIQFYLPTKEYALVRAYRKKHGMWPENLRLKVSHPKVGETYDDIDIPFSTVGRDDDKDMSQCPARTQGNKCLDCRACWTGVNVNYPLH